MARDRANLPSCYRLKAMAPWGRDVFVACATLDQALARQAELRFFGFTHVTIGTPEGQARPMGDDAARGLAVPSSALD